MAQADALLIHMLMVHMLGGLRHLSSAACRHMLHFVLWCYSWMALSMLPVRSSLDSSLLTYPSLLAGSGADAGWRGLVQCD